MVGETTKRAPHVGDKYDIPVEVIGVGHPAAPKRYKVRVRGSEPGRLEDWICGATLDASKLVEAAPRPIGIGDRVTWGGGYTSYRVHSIDSGWAFLTDPIMIKDGTPPRGVNPTTWVLSELRRVD